MPTHMFALEPGGPKRLEISFGFAFKNARVLLDGQEIGAFADRRALRTGATYPLPDGSELSVRLSDGIGGPGLDVRRNGVPVPGSSDDGAARMRTAGAVIYVIAALSILLGVVALSGVEFLAAMGYGWGSIVFGGAFFVLGRFTQKGSKVALGIALMLFVLESVAAVIVSVSVNGRPPVGMMFVRVLLIIQMAKGFGGGRKPSTDVSPS